MDRPAKKIRLQEDHPEGSLDDGVPPAVDESLGLMRGAVVEWSKNHPEAEIKVSDPLNLNLQES